VSFRGRVLTIVFSKLNVQFRMALAELSRVLEEALGGDGEEFL